MSETFDLQWGTVPPVVIELATLLAAKASGSARHFQRISWPSEPRDVQVELRYAIGDAHKITKAGTDLRALLSAYAHKFHTPRPVISDLARAQDTSSQGYVRRYSEGTTDAVASLLSVEPDLDLILSVFPSVSMADLAQVSGPAGEAARLRMDLREPRRQDE